MTTKPLNAQRDRRGKDAVYRKRVKARAIEAMGGRCCRCGFNDARALQFDHVKPVRRGSSGLRLRGSASTETHLAVLRGSDEFQLLCANCHSIKTYHEDGADGTLHHNVGKGTKGDLLLPSPV